jgi:hypothetical protein
MATRSPPRSFPRAELGEVVYSYRGVDLYTSIGVAAGRALKRFVTTCYVLAGQLEELFERHTARWAQQQLPPLPPAQLTVLLVDLELDRLGSALLAAGLTPAAASLRLGHESAVTSAWYGVDTNHGRSRAFACLGRAPGHGRPFFVLAAGHLTRVSNGGGLRGGVRQSPPLVARSAMERGAGGFDRLTSPSFRTTRFQSRRAPITTWVVPGWSLRDGKRRSGEKPT